MRKIKVYYKENLVDAIFNLPDNSIVDIHVGKDSFKGIPKKDLMVSIVDYEYQFQKTEKLKSDISKIMDLIND